MIIYVVTGWSNTCPSEKFEAGSYKTRERAEEVMEISYQHYSNCEFEIEEMWVEE